MFFLQLECCYYYNQYFFVVFSKKHQHRETNNKNNMIPRRELRKLGWRQGADLASPRIRGFLKADERRSGDSFAAVDVWSGCEHEAGRCALTVPAKSVGIKWLCRASAFCVRLFPHEAHPIVRTPRTPVCRSLGGMRFEMPQASQQDVLLVSSYPTSTEGKIHEHIVAIFVLCWLGILYPPSSPIEQNVVYGASPLRLKKK